MNFSEQDHAMMQRAIGLARRGQYTTKPNPNVGCVIVKENKVLGEGFHPQAGQPHAEVFALKQAGENAVGATAYVTLEPCAHFGRTPPCAYALVNAKIKKVVIANLDPNPLVAGKGVKILTDAGMTVYSGLCAEQAHELNAGFLKYMAKGLPYVRLKIASSLDGRTAMASGESKWITGEPARQDVQHWRAISGAVITGIETVLADDCLLNVRTIEPVIQPKRIVLDRQGRLPLTAKILQQPENTYVMTPFRQELADLNIHQIEVQPLADLLQYLAKEQQIYDVLIEAGATLSSAFLQQHLVDEVIHYIAPTLLGQSARAMFTENLTTMAQQQRFNVKEMTQIGEDLRLRLVPLSE